MTETAEQAARRLAADAIRDGYAPTALHEYRDADGTPLLWRIRCKRADGAKWIRPMHLNGNGYQLGEPKAPAAGRPLYRLPELLAADTGAVVFVVEGETCADALGKLGLLATTSGSSSSATGADWTPLQGHAVVLWPDNDAPGMKYAAAVAERLRALGCDVRTVARDVVQALPEGGDVVDWLAEHPGASAADVQGLPATAPERQGVEPEPLRRPMPEPQAYPLDALGDVLGSAARAIHDVVKAPAAMCGTSLLAAASLATQAQANVTHDGRTEPLSLWACTIGESGERKSAVDGWALGAHYRHERNAQADYAEALKAYAPERAAYDAACQKAKGGKGATRDSIRQALADVGEPPEAPLSPLLVLGEPTLEGAQRQLIQGWPSLGLFSDDAGEFLGGYSMGREQKTRTAAALSKLWDKGTFDRVRAKADEAGAKHYGKRLALHFMVQPVIAEAVLSDPILCGQGFLPRCLLAWPTSTIGGRDYNRADLSEHPALRRYWAKVHALLDLPYPLADGTRNQLEPRALALTPDARELWEQVQNAIEREQADGGRYASIRAWASKAGAQVLRVSGVLTLLDNPDAGSIDRATVEQAAELMLWHLGEAVRIVGTAAVPLDVRNAESLLGWCHDTGRRLLCSADAMQYGPGSIRTKRAFDAAVQELERAGWADPIDGGAVVDGKHRRRVWQVVGGDV